MQRLKDVRGTPTTTAPGQESATTLNQEAYRRLEEMIVTLELAPGALVSEAILSRQLGIGTTPIREALQRLAREYLVEIIPRRGVVVTTIDVRRQFEVLETRRELDRLLSSAAARRSNALERKAFAANFERTERSVADGDTREFLRLDAELNQLLSKAARNATAAALASTLHTVSRRFWFYHHDQHNPLGEIGPVHCNLVEAIASGDPARAGRASNRLIDYLTTFAQSTLPHPLPLD
ncbi:MULTISPECIES: GntR family transcriptional regulator [unclassified Caballeronia]|uniref:GntR family transcriptional regulator n=1 Tax=unclassified Caballeronia TaxID=2646786 RepID=UPI001F3ADB84|nr:MULTISPECIES: GntR family transcriptional regulator [unclassified Caballeronia]MCE4547248.1 GntR family transcriptional regulator [Caballeronia sp. PC1]MCE4575230.1 GntR family transcriptional regulator [Caballeronia sp. CLC5]MDR5749005.1 GntR family transcriptional regulator [Caballeronia sp. LZ029]